MKNYRKSRGYENVEKCIFEGAGKFGIPIIGAISTADFEPGNFISFNYANSLRTVHDKETACIHFFIDDYQFERIWKEPDRYTDLFSEFGCILSPDFSLYLDFPYALQIYNHYRKHWIGAYMQNYGIKVIPTIAWSDEKSYEWCFDGEPRGGMVAVSSVGTGTDRRAEKFFTNGYKEMLSRLEPEKIIFYGDIPDGCSGDIIKIKTFQDKFKEAALLNGW